MIKTGICTLAIALAAAASADELYRWVDEDGKVHFGDRPPMQAEADNIGDELQPINAADATRARKATQRGQRDDLQKNYESRKQRKQRQRQQQMARACQKARKRLRALQGRVAFVDENGKEIKTTERERQRMAEKLQREIRRVCR
ncbi:DUF4124 domain-containing protein [Microbulbifer halophilus]|uniref:DUF4124 domain-containing protein n=1 Tax=Microbulbifer halophilus TaxID=453963 RepID=A0ABW5EGA7_9GAMM|nr:DUF4124 domain-containing protein [Microbulbifer halophilus]MCW8126284.1 DUF4124 domain-containing protein [Microbulbifer halophilus]